MLDPQRVLARRVCLHVQPIKAPAAAKLGLVDEVVPLEQLLDAAKHHALDIAEGRRPRNLSLVRTDRWACRAKRSTRQNETSVTTNAQMGCAHIPGGRASQQGQMSVSQSSWQGHDAGVGTVASLLSWRTRYTRHSLGLLLGPVVKPRELRPMNDAPLSPPGVFVFNVGANVGWSR
eukprot:366229-Chlamydomonas_euryale.AAC.68